MNAERKRVRTGEWEKRRKQINPGHWRRVYSQEAFDFTRKAALLEGLLIGISSGASLAAVQKKLPEMTKGARILTFCYNTGERYLSVSGLFE